MAKRIAVPDFESTPPAGTPETSEILPEVDEELTGLPGDVVDIADATYHDWSWVIYRIRSASDLDRDRTKNDRVIVTKRFGPLDVMEIQRDFGGGKYELWGFNQGHLRRRIQVELAGPDRVFTKPEPAKDVPASNGSVTSSNPEATDRVVTYLGQLERKIERLEDRIANNGNGNHPQPGLKEMAETLVMLDKLRGGNAVPKDPDVETVKTMWTMVEKGMELGARSEGTTVVQPPAGPEQYVELAKAFAPTIDKFITAILARQRIVHRPPGGAVPTQESRADVIDTPETKPARPEISHRWATAIECLAKAIARGDDPSDFATTLEDVLDDQEFGLLRFASLEDVNRKLEPAMEHLPVLRTTQGQEFISTVLEEIKTTPSTPAE